LMGAHAVALGQTKTKASKGVEPEVLERELFEMLDSVYREMEDEPKNRNGGVLVPQTSTVFPPDPDNAALLYYQAMLYRPQPDADTEELIYKALRGAEPDEKVRKYLNQQSCRKTIKLAEAAARIPECNWGILRSQGFGFNSLAFRRLYFLLEVDARTLAADGDYRSALGRCLTLFRLARHIHRMFISSLSVGGRAFDSIRHILGSMPPDADILTWLQGQLVIVSGASISCAEMLETDFEFVLGLVRKEPDTLEGARDDLEKKAKDDITKKEIQGLTDDELLARAQQSYAKFLNSVLRVIGSGMPYEKTYTEIQRLINKLEEQANSDPVIILWPCVLVIDNMYELQVRHTAEFNALKAAIEIYLVKAKTGQFPEKLPDGLPKDPYTGGDFGYEITDEGFALRCQGEEFQKGRMRQRLEFKVKK
ncbi:MAG: hypothetical protein KAV87_27340, partial [Desulfobacteraceae bacterium]|nr:hypothetical protein [Desulfobacteraceae bacterium]